MNRSHLANNAHADNSHNFEPTNRQKRFCGGGPVWPSVAHGDHRGQPSLELNRKQADGTDDLISRALGQLSLKDRERALQEMHGVNENRPEQPEFVVDMVRQMQQELFRLSKLDGIPHLNAFRLAELQNADFVYSSVSCERFLRATDFNVAAAADKLVQFYDWKMLLWGEQAVARDIELTDLDEQDIDIMKKGYFQTLPARDRAGRPVCVSILNNQVYPSARSAGRIMWYSYQCRRDHVSEDIMVGVCIYLAEPSLASMKPDLLEMYQKLTSLWPIKTAAYHHCVSDSASGLFKAFLNHVLIPMDSEHKAKTKVHTGSKTEWTYELMTYGIPPNLIPITDDGKIKVKTHLEFLQGKKTREVYANSGLTRAFISLPLNSDILLGRGKTIHQAPGNLRLAAIVDAYVLDYHKLVNKHEKTALASQVVRMVKAASARFLAKESKLWVEVSDDAAREKVSGIFRTLYRTQYSDVKAAAQKEAVETESQALKTPRSAIFQHDEEREQSAKRKKGSSIQQIDPN